ncbi:helix-turn-helix domain-containing protein [Leptospira bandrabouensis]|uniref:helix-turn-helix domain-containing protein n=1 Tax=Leptospira bandrabouensis TaxID=2484903 RepID=UPI00223D7A38|nr:helix-turn-helix domain-containing protein [Leptospira bandrabouensis]MCW7460138.1 helix-turn-helix domain-containing protein [Leptospira bandrabouensis]MCW7479345.1 helix-turn-helix domain-containing protein [Leptospira bandrabouensis]MCW7487027.1 helix-turn-helix domain-containing protein [Leptospira bandrabouensis]
MRTGLWIPVEIEVLPLNSTEKYLLSEVVALDRVGECFASNAHFAELLGVRSDSISRIISKLKKLGYLKQGRFDGRRRTLIPTLGNQSLPKPNSKKAEKPEQDKRGTQRTTGVNAEAAFAILQSPSYIVQKQNNVQKSWDEFLKWSKEKISKSSYDSILEIGDPDKLLGNSKSMWKMWSTI